ncbi:MAG TPA: CBS domain-containing protein [Candidatus Dormibacteraeota bacterium]|nr:CBS domain-containing protein [Candidatus Dormibacteraeota bacterium]
MRVYFSQVVGRPVLARMGDRVGAVADGIVKLVDGSMPALTGILLRVENRDVFVSIDNVAKLTDSALHLSRNKVDMRTFERRPGEVLLARDVRGGAVIDVEGARLVRVRDVVLEGEGKLWRVVAVVSAPPTTFTTFFKGLFGARQLNEEIPWSRLEPLVGHVPSAGLLLPFGRLSKLHPADIADIVEQARHEEGEQILSAVQSDRELEADVFEEMSEDKQLEYLKDRSNEEAATVLSNMNPDDAADLLTKVDQERRKPMLEALEPDQEEKVRALLGYGEDSAGGLMSNEFLALPEERTVAEAIEHIRRLEEEPHILTVVYALQEGKLSGAIPIARLFRADSADRLKDLVEREPVALYPDADLPSVAVEMTDYNLSALPVVDQDYKILGVITYDDLIEAMLPEDWRWRGRSHRPS